jgi:DNA end-binding protein Ku
MAARAIWKGVITFDGTELPVKLYSAAQDQNVHFHLLHDQDMVRLRQRMINAETGDEVDPKTARKGVEVEPGRYIVVTDEELEKLKPESARQITIERFVEPSLINHQWYDRPYYLGPDESDGDYFAFAEALESEGVEGVARWTMRNKEYVGALRHERGYLLMNTLRYASEVIPPAAIDVPGGRKLEAKEVKLAEQLVGALADEFNIGDFHDEYRQRVMELIERKARGEKIEVGKVVEKKPPRKSLTDVLEASLAAVR